MGTHATGTHGSHVGTWRARVGTEPLPPPALHPAPSTPAAPGVCSGEQGMGRGVRVAAGELGAARCSSGQLGSTQLSSVWLGSAWHTSARHDPSRLGTARLSAAPAARRDGSYEALGKSDSAAVPGTARADPQPPPELPEPHHSSRPAGPPGGLSPARGAAASPPSTSGAARAGSRGLSWGWGLGGGWLRQRHQPGSTPHPPQIAGGFTVTPVLGWQRDSRTTAGQRDGSQPSWRLEGGFSSQFVCESLALCWVIFFFFSVLLLFCRGEGEEGGLAPAIKAELPAAAGSSPPP